MSTVTERVMTSEEIKFKFKTATYEDVIGEVNEMVEMKQSEERRSLCDYNGSVADRINMGREMNKKIDNYHIRLLEAALKRLVPSAEGTKKSKRSRSRSPK